MAAAAPPPPPPPPRAAIGSTGSSAAAAAVLAGERRRAGWKGSSSVSVKRAAATGQGVAKRGLNVNGCGMLSPAAKARLIAAVGY